MDLNDLSIRKLYLYHFKSNPLPIVQMDSQPQCHPEKSRARTDQDLQAEQDEFFLSGAQTSVKMLSSDNKETKHHCYTPSLPVLSDVIENDQRIKPITAPVMKAPLKPIKLTRKVMNQVSWVI